MKLFGNKGHLAPHPGIFQDVACDVCKAQMKVQRNIFGPTSLVESQAGKGHRHDFFSCPNYRESWHVYAVGLIRRAEAEPARSVRERIVKEIMEVLQAKKVPKP